MTNGICNQCGNKIRFGISLCKECNNRRRHNTAIVSQNKKKLSKLLEEKIVTMERLGKFILYTDNIIKCGRVLVEYRDNNTKRFYEKIVKTGITVIGFILIIGVLTAC